MSQRPSKHYYSPPAYSTAQPQAYTTPSFNGMSTNQTRVNMSATSRDRDGITSVGGDFEDTVGLRVRMDAHPRNLAAQQEVAQALRFLFERGSGVDMSATSADINQRKTVRESYTRRVGPSFSI